MKVTICTIVSPMAEIPDDAEIQDCDLAFECPKHWGYLTPTDFNKVRFCPTCSKTVHFCSTSGELWDARQAGQCVAYLAEYRDVQRVLLGVPSEDVTKR